LAQLYTVALFKPLGMTIKGAAACYVFALAYIIIMVVLGLWWNRHLYSAVIDEGWSSRVIARIAIFTALSAAGGLITLPGATSIRFDSLAGYFATLMFGWQIGAIVAAFGALFSELMSGFSGWAPLAPYYMITMAFAVTCFGFATKKWGRTAGIIAGTLANTMCVVPWPLMMGWGMLATTFVQQVVGSYANCLLAAIAFSMISAAQQRRRYEEPVDEEELRIVNAMIEEDARLHPGRANKYEKADKTDGKNKKGSIMLFLGISIIILQVIMLLNIKVRTKKFPDLTVQSMEDLINFVKVMWIGILGVVFTIAGAVKRIKSSRKTAKEVQ